MERLLFVFDYRNSETVAGQKTAEATGLKVWLVFMWFLCAPVLFTSGRKRERRWGGGVLDSCLGVGVPLRI